MLPPKLTRFYQRVLFLSGTFLSLVMTAAVDGVVIDGDIPNGAEWLLSKEAVEFVAQLHRQFNGQRLALLEARHKRQVEFDAGKLPDFLPETEWIRKQEWRCDPPPADLEDRRVEITGPPDRKMVINALNSGANAYMTDFEDSLSPTFANLLNGQVNLHDSIKRTITFDGNGKHYQLNEKTATLLVRPRGWHLDEDHAHVDGQPISASIFDFGLYFFHNVHLLLQKGTGPYFYLPKMESHLEARLWNDIFLAAQNALGIQPGTIRATVLIETLPAAFEMDEIIYELRQHSIGLNCGRWDYIFSFIKKLKNHPQFVLPDRDEVGMTRPFMDAYVRLLIATCHRRGVHAMGGMAAQIPIKDDKKANEEAMKKVEADKLREVKAGHDGTWVAHPGLIPFAKKAFDAHMKGKNQLSFMPQYSKPILSEDLFAIGNGGSITRRGLTMNLDVALRYVESWLRGFGCVPIYQKMEDAATAEISRAQVWHWIRHGVALDDGTKVTMEFVNAEFNNVIGEAMKSANADNRFELASKILHRLILECEFSEFLTLDCYKHILNHSRL